MYFLLNLSHYVKSCGHFYQIWHFFPMPAHQIWSYHVTQESISKIFYFFLILHLILGKVLKFIVEKLEIISQKSHRGWKTLPPPSAFRVKSHSLLFKLQKPDHQVRVSNLLFVNF